MENNRYPKRKGLRLKDYDYSTAGTYFITICTIGRKCILSAIDEHENTDVDIESPSERPFAPVLTKIGELAQTTIDNLPNVYPLLQIDDYVIMPNHIHIILTIDDANGQPKAAPTLGQIINQLKGALSKQIGKKIWQKSFYEHIIRDASDYDEKMKYLYENPMRWHYDELYIKS